MTGGQALPADRSPQPPKSAVRIVRLPAARGPALTPRDREIVEWICRYGVVTADQVARRFFSRPDGTVGTGAAYRRLRKLRELDLLRSDFTFYREPSVLRVTLAGSRLAAIGIGPARLVLADVRHSLAVVDIVEQLLAIEPDLLLETERELRIEYRGELARGKRPGRGRLPDAALTRGNHRIAVEVDLTSKRSNDYQSIVEAYVIQRQYKEVWWYIRPTVLPRLEAIVRRNRASFISVRPLPSEDR